MAAKRYTISMYPRGTKLTQGIDMEKLTKPASQRLKVQYNLRIEPELLEWLKEQGEKYERPVNYIINHAIKQLKKEQEI